ncbi:hypothetical protein [Jiella sonneratiae]|uniref:DUF1127 domain-containing protein n=1 Tax=Jiella sonneratiae TaxID=2816856 RepID=A0ABS3J0Y6_9HYPH|nr:hypothetical protein [Jiella sonneratiae]MBO0902800.1 hypothetical protein [Jiella sonneratiae]
MEEAMLQNIYLPTVDGPSHSRDGLGLRGWLRSWTAERRHQKLRRDAIATLLRVDDDILRDVTGLERRQVEAAARLPLCIDALEHLQRLQQRQMRG